MFYINISLFSLGGEWTPAWGQVQDGDGILAIGSYDAAQLSHAQASQMIKNSGNILQLTVQKYVTRITIL